MRFTNRSAQRRLLIASFAVLLAGMSPEVSAQKTTVTIQAAGPGKPISPDLFGVFFEDLNYAADGGLYAELIQNRSFEYSPEERRHRTREIFGLALEPPPATTPATPESNPVQPSQTG